MKFTIRPYRNGGLEVDFTINFRDDLPPYRVRLHSPFDTKAQTKKWAERTYDEIKAKGRPLSRLQKKLLPKNLSQKAQPKEALTLRAFVPRWLSGYVEAENLSSTTYEERKRQIERYLLPLLGERSLASIGVEDYQQLKLHLKMTQYRKPRDPGSINALVGLLYQILTWAHTFGELAQLPPKPTRLKVPKKERTPYFPEEVVRLLTAAKTLGPMPYLVVLLGADAGLRSGEMMGLRWCDVEVEVKELRIRQQANGQKAWETKGKESRSIPLTDRLLLALKTHRSLTERVLWHPRRGVPFDRSLLRSLMVSIERRAGLPQVGGLHRLRHAFASELLGAGVGWKEVQELLGHKSPMTTQVYAHLLPSSTTRAIRLLEKFRGEGTETTGRS